MPIFDTPEPITVTFELAVTNVLVTATDRATTTVTVRPHRADRDVDLRAVEQTQVTFANGHLSISQPKGWRTFTPLGGHGEVDIDVELPIGSRIRGESSVGSFEAMGQLAGCTFTTTAGDLTVDDVETASLRTTAGSIDVGRLGGESDVTTSAGSIRIGQIDGTARVKNSTGSTTIGRADGELHVQGAYGSIAIERTSDTVEVKTAYGDLRIDEVVRGAVRMESSYGELQVGIREGTAVWLDAQSTMGRVRNSLQPDEGPDGSDDTADVYARTSFGNIVVRRTSASAARSHTAEAPSEDTPAE
ncbi:MAG: hypothetical protein JWP75_1330 [Frondihabitans sp.]|nr:hypothetical protein [Frondihabitans sp.]